MRHIQMNWKCRFIVVIIFSLLTLKIASFALKIPKAFGNSRFLSGGRKPIGMNAQGRLNGGSKIYTKTIILLIKQRIYSTEVSLSNLRFDNRNLDVLPVDSSNLMGSRIVKGAIFSTVVPTPIKNPVLIAKSSSALSVLGIDGECSELELAEYLGGNQQIPGSRTAAQVYCGFQFGSFAGQLGDGAAIYLGEVINPTSGIRWELQLKGAGKTPFSRTADGRKVLRSSVREFLCSEAMSFLNVPTTRAATCVTSDTTVERDPVNQFSLYMKYF